MGHRKGRRKREREQLRGIIRCAFYEDIVCPFDKKSRFLTSRCMAGCEYYTKFMEEMDREEVAEASWIEAVRRNPEAYMRGGL